MFGDGSLTFREFAMREPLPLATIHAAVLEFLRGREDAALFGAQAVNAYVDEPRMTQDVDILSPRAEDLAEELRTELSDRFQIAVRVRTVVDGLGFRLYQLRKPKNRHLVDVRQSGVLPQTRVVAEIRVVAPAELVAQKVLGVVARGKTAKGLTDLADVRRLLLAFPELRVEGGAVADALRRAAVPESTLNAWSAIAAEEIEEDAEDY